MQIWDFALRNALWSRNRLQLFALPEDVVEKIGFKLTVDALDALLTALLGYRPSASDRKHVAEVPKALLAPWLFAMRSSAADAICKPPFVDFALYHARECLEVVGLLDWSPYAKRAAIPVLVVRWDSMRTSVKVDQFQLNFAVATAIKHALPAARLTLHRVSFKLQPRFEKVIEHSPFYATCVDLVPNALLMQVKLANIGTSVVIARLRQCASHSSTLPKSLKMTRR